jgi:hypothetical protein
MLKIIAVDFSQRIKKSAQNGFSQISPRVRSEIWLKP